MAEAKAKSATIEKAAARLFPQLGKEVEKRAWTPGAFAALLVYIAEANGAKFATPEGRKQAMADLADSDVQYNSNFKKYATARGWLPGGTVVPASSFE